MNALIDWLGSGGKPVDRELAEFRTNDCLYGNNGERCPEHRGGKWWENAKSAIAVAIRDQLEEKHKMNLNLKHENEMEMCRVCGCSMRLKPWVPIDHIRQSINPSKIPDFPSFCWLRKELLG